jgi:hypothetical protein
MHAAAAEARFPRVAPGAGHYESFYLKTGHPDGGLAAWIRYTVHKRPGAEPKGSVWFTLFDVAANGPRAAKETLPPDALGTGAAHYLHVGDSLIAPGRASGAIESPQLEARWELAFEGAEEPLRHLPRAWMYRAPVPRTKLESPHPALEFRGSILAGGRAIEVEGWPGMMGHNWGAQHAERWIWLHGAGFEAGGWLDVALGRIKLGPFVTPWVANGVLVLGGERHRLGGIERVRSTSVRESPTACELSLPGAEGLEVRGRVEAPRQHVVGWVYADPDGSEHNTLNCSIADLHLRVERDGGPPAELTVSGGAAYELGVRERDHGIPVQPFADG